jgi:soluble lytic murein transglycosylase-like protein
LARLILALLSVPLFGASDAAAARDPVDRWQPHVSEAAARFDMPEEWIRRVIRAESGGYRLKEGRPIVSSAGAMGLMQLMPGTWAEMRQRHGLGPDPHDPRDNIIAGTAYLRTMFDRFGYPGLFAAYNAGPARYEHHLATGHKLPAETRSYVASIAQGKPDKLPGNVSAQLIYFRRGLALPEGRDRPVEAVAGRGLFVALANPL